MISFFRGSGQRPPNIAITIPFANKAPRSGAKANAAVGGAGAQASRKCTFAQLAEDTPVPNAACWRKTYGYTLQEGEKCG